MDRQEYIARAMMKALKEGGWFVGPGDDPEDLELLTKVWEAGKEADEAFVSKYFPSTPKGEVRVGQIWQDNDTRQRKSHNPRRGKIVQILGGYATVEWSTGRTTQVSLKRFRPNSTGYKLVEDALDGHAIGALALGWPNPRPLKQGK